MGSWGLGLHTLQTRPAGPTAPPSRHALAGGAWVPRTARRESPARRSAVGGSAGLCSLRGWHHQQAPLPLPHAPLYLCLPCTLPLAREHVLVHEPQAHSLLSDLTNACPPRPPPQTPFPWSPLESRLFVFHWLHGLSYPLGPSAPQLTHSCPWAAHAHQDWPLPQAPPPLPDLFSRAWFPNTRDRFLLPCWVKVNKGGLDGETAGALSVVSAHSRSGAQPLIGMNQETSAGTPSPHPSPMCP